jgi:stage II sporulation protein R
MKKLLAVLILFAGISVINDFKTNSVVIPKESIRFRVIANSDSNEDQALKLKVKDNLNKEISNILKTSNNINDSRELLKNNISKLKTNIDNTLKDSKSNTAYTINYGENYFPEKEYKGVKYQEGEYESLVVKLGKGEGQNFWCVLFPPLCLVDENKENAKDIEYRVLIKDILDKYFK